MKLPSGWVARPKVDRKGVKVSVEMSDLILCEDCKYFEDDSVMKLNGMPIIAAHEVCTKWGRGCCQTRKDGWCFLAEKNESEDQL